MVSARMLGCSRSAFLRNMGWSTILALRSGEGKLVPAGAPPFSEHLLPRVMLTHSGGAGRSAPVDEVITCDYLGPQQIGGN